MEDDILNAVPTLIWGEQQNKVPWGKADEVGNECHFPSKVASSPHPLDSG